MSQFVEYTEPVWRNLNMNMLEVDEAYLLLKSYFENITYLYSWSEACYTCPYSKVKVIHAQESSNLSVNVAYYRKFKLLTQDVGNYAFENVTSLCEHEGQWGEFGVYNLTINASGQCSWLTDKEPVNMLLFRWKHAETSQTLQSI